jgi:hypothetical protein
VHGNGWVDEVAAQPPSGANVRSSPAPATDVNDIGANIAPSFLLSAMAPLDRDADGSRRG